MNVVVGATTCSRRGWTQMLNMNPCSMALADVQGKLMLSEEQRNGAMAIFQRLKQALHGCQGIQQIDLSGSLARGTAMSQDFDLDIRLLVCDSHWASLGPLKKQVQSTLAREKVQFKSGSCEHILKISLKNSEGQDFFADLVFTSQRAVGNKQELESHENLDEPNIKSKSLAFRAFYALQNDKKLIKQYDMNLHSSNHIRELIVLTKFWKVRTIEALKQSNKHNEANRFSWVKSIHLELACLTAVQEMSEGQGFQLAFGRVLTLLARDLDNSALASQLEMNQSYLGLQKAASSVLKTEARKSLRKMGFAPPGSTEKLFMFCRPSEIRFTQQKCSPTFSDRDGHGSLTIGETAAEVAAKEIHKRDIPMIRIVEAEAEGGKLYSVDNRRLGVFRLLEMTGKTKIVKVEAVAMSDLHKKEWKNKFSTQTDGLIIEVLGRNGQNYGRIGTTRSNTTYPLPPISSSRSSSWSMEDLESEDETGPATKRLRVA